ncbi:LysR family transcriptional regulator [Paenibacillus senegalensis]|uniref:LysR family transcriptional regulator n=1 Tax=Paenibacillus senegalensis TaxID=1465766 RepID=UPI0002892AFD|nr:LysR family transcriptional regulator [Paenibacillus senegalensis]
MRGLELMDTFLTVVERGSYTEAARRLYCSQPTISHHIQQLEEHFQCQLLHRSAKPIRVTEQGEVVLNYARKIRDLMEKAELQVRQLQLKQEKILQIYVSNYISGCYFSGILPYYRQHFPKQLIEIHTACYSELQQALLDGRANMAFLPVYPEDEQLAQECTAHVLFEEELVLVVPGNHPWLRRKMLYSRDLQAAQVLLPQSKYICQYITEQLERKSIKVQYLQMSNFSTIKQSIVAGLGVSFLPKAVIQTELQQGELAAVRVSGLKILRQNGFMIRKGYQPGDAEQAFSQAVERYFRQNGWTRMELIGHPMMNM